MSAPDTNIEKQTKRHRPALWAIGAVIVFGAIVFLSMVSTAVDDEDAPGEGGVLMQNE